MSAPRAPPAPLASPAPPCLLPAACPCLPPPLSLPIHWVTQPQVQWPYYIIPLVTQLHSENLYHWLIHSLHCAVNSAWSESKPTDPASLGNNRIKLLQQIVNSSATRSLSWLVLSLQRAERLFLDSGRLQPDWPPAASGSARTGPALSLHSARTEAHSLRPQSAPHTICEKSWQI